MSDPAPLYVSHIEERQQKAEVALQKTGFDALVIHSGIPSTYFADDRAVPFISTPHFASWVPLAGPNHILLVRPGAKPVLVRVKPEDYWYEQAPVGNPFDSAHGKPFWISEFDAREVPGADLAWEELSLKGKIAYIGVPEAFESRGIDSNLVNPSVLVSHLDWDRSFKTQYEISCISEANKVAAAGHHAGKEAFLRGASEFEIHQAYMGAVGSVERDLPYETIVALNEKGAILHYEGKRKDVRGGKSLLLDAGANYLGYASDITRTYAHPDADPLFVELLDGVEKLQKELCLEIKIGMPFTALHESAHWKIGELLIALDILKTDTKTAVERALTKTFFPHGVGHFLGIQVHDVGGKQKTPEGGMTDNGAVSLRTTRTIEAGQVFTVEPGVYFIEMLLRSHRAGETSEYFEWKTIDRLMPYGGVRIEDDVFVAETGIRNLTKEHLL